MVGVPGRSKGCITCRRRKVKCDEAKPTCRRCAQARFECEGYRRDLRVVHALDRFRMRDTSNESHASSSSSTGPDAPDLPQMPELWPFLEEISMNFLLRTFFKQRKTRSLFSHNSEWLEDCYSIDPDDVGRLSASCLATGYFGRMHSHDNRVRRYSERKYGQAVRVLAERLKDPNACWDYRNLSAAMALHCYEFLINTDSQGWIEHAGGIARFVEARGPERHQDYPEHGIFMWARQRIVTFATLKRERTFLEKEEWLSKPWAKHPETIEPWRDLYELQVFLPGLFEDADAVDRAAITRTQAVHSPEREELASRIRDHVEKLLRWRFRWEQENGNCASERPASTITNSISDIPRPAEFDPILWFSDVSYAIELAIYNGLLSCLIYLAVRVFQQDILRQVLERIPPDERAEAKGPLVLPHEGLTIRDITTETSRTADYFLTTIGVTDESLPMLYTMRTNILMYYLVLEDNQKIIWLTRILKRIAEKCGLGGAERLTLVRPPVAGEGPAGVPGGSDQRLDPEGGNVPRPDIRLIFLPLESMGQCYTPEML